jgi:hypothetical protein
MFKVLKKGDIILFFILLAIGAGVFALTWNGSTQGTTAVVRVNGEVYGTYSLSVNRTVKINQKNGHKNEFSIKDGSVQMTYANCKNQVCVETGSISRSGEQIVCAPNRVSITITGGKGGSRYDAVS